MSSTVRRFVHINETDHSLAIQEDRAPAPGADEVLIDVAYAGINRADLLQRKGLYPPPADASPIMGLEVAGTVLACGEAVTGWKPGDRVCALTHGGGYASLAIAPQGQCLPVPDGYSLREAAALPEALLTVWHNLFQRARLQAGENVLIHGGASGIGTLAVSICRAMGATVYSTAGTTEKCRRIETLGAKRTFNYREEDFVAELAELGLGNGMHVILDMVGGDFIQKNLAAAAPEGRIVNIAFLRGFSAEVNFLPLLMKRLTLTGSTLRAQSAEQKARMVEEIREHLHEHMNHGRVKPVVDSEYALDEAEAAHSRMASGEHMGKILLKP
ncbi:MAG: NADPH2:quinone reductase [Halieaceae bacterium]|jgi:NADPH2:quinone reductase